MQLIYIPDLVFRLLSLNIKRQLLNISSNYVAYYFEIKNSNIFFTNKKEELLL